MVRLTPNASYSLRIRYRAPNEPGSLARVTQVIATTGGSVGDIRLLEQDAQHTLREIDVNAASSEQQQAVEQALQNLDGIEVLGVIDRTFELHRGGKISVVPKMALRQPDELAMAYTPGVARICRAIADKPEVVFDLTIKRNTVAIVTDGSAILGLGNLGPEAALPVMEGKAMLFKVFGDVDAFPICLATQDSQEIIETVKRLAPVFGGVNLEDIAAPRCFEIEARLREETDIPIFHDDQHGTAIVTLAALRNALKLVNKSLEQVRIVMNGAGAAGLAVASLLRKAGATQITICDSRGILSTDRNDLSAEKQAFAVPQGGSLADAVQGADVFIGVSVPDVLTPDMVRSMADQRIVFAMANPIPEIQPELVKDDVAVIATGRSDYPNQINNVLAFPGLFRGALDCRTPQLTEAMFLAAAEAIAQLVDYSDLQAGRIIPSVFDARVAPAVAFAVARAAREEGLARV